MRTLMVLITKFKFNSLMYPMLYIDLQIIRRLTVADIITVNTSFLIFTGKHFFHYSHCSVYCFPFLHV